jgi:hypothetical protein
MKPSGDDILKGILLIAAIAFVTWLAASRPCDEYCQTKLDVARGLNN